MNGGWSVIKTNTPVMAATTPDVAPTRDKKIPRSMIFSVIRLKECVWRHTSIFSRGSKRGKR